MLNWKKKKLARKATVKNYAVHCQQKKNDTRKAPSYCFSCQLQVFRRLSKKEYEYCEDNEKYVYDCDKLLPDYPSSK